MSGPVLAFVEHAGGEPDRLSLEAVALARGLATALGAPLEAVILGSGAEAAAARLGNLAFERRLVGLGELATTVAAFGKAA
jgi:hypothetical protein